MRLDSRVAGRGEALVPERRRFDAPALASVRYADPAAWIVASSVANAADPMKEAFAAAHDRTGVVAIGADGPTEAMAAMNEASRALSSSPIRYPASNAGSLAGLASIALGLRGPTLVLTLPPDRGVPVGLLVADAWLRRGVVSFMAVATCREAGGRPVGRCLLLAREGEMLDDERDVPWLLGAP